MVGMRMGLQKWVFMGLDRPKPAFAAMIKHGFDWDLSFCSNWNQLVLLIPFAKGKIPVKSDG